MNSGDDTNNTTTLANVTGMNLSLAANTTYTFEYVILFQGSSATAGIGLALNGPAGATVISYTVDIPTAADGTSALYSGWGTAWDDVVISTGVQATGTTYAAHVFGVVKTAGTAGTMTPRFRRGSSASTATIKDGSWGELFTP
jgi:hypothetical protein